MANSVLFESVATLFCAIQSAYGFPVDISTVDNGHFNSAWLASSPVFAVIVLFVIIVALFGCVCCRPGNGFKEFRNSNGALSTATEPGFVNPRAGAELTIFPPVGVTPPLQPICLEVPLEVKQNAALRPASFSSSERPLSSQDWFYEPHLNFPRGQLQYHQNYGHGWFGRVVEGEAALICPPQPRTKVIVKILHEDATPTDQMFFLHEVKAHRDLKHPNILRLLGRCLEKEPFLLLLEYCPNGDLKTFLTQNLASAGALTEQGVILRMAQSITAGLEYMHQHKFIHTDLAARNCLVTPDLSIKIGDYGNSIELFREDYYIAGSVALPVRWCAPETLRCTDLTIETKEVTTFANVRTLAIVFWELTEFGKLPYEELTDDQVIVKVLGEKNYFLQSPKLHCLFKEELYHLMKLCWNPPLQRPTASQIKMILDNLVSSGKSVNPDSAPIDFEQRWMQSKPNTIPKTDNAEIASRPHGSKVRDSSLETPIEAFREDAKPLGLESPRFHLTKSDSVQNLSGSLERLNEEAKTVYNLGGVELDSWLKGVEVNNEDDEKFVRNISEAIRDLDAALALEKSSSSEEASGKSSKENSPGRTVKISNDVEEFDAPGMIVDFRLGGDTSSYMSMPPKSFELSSLQNTMEPPSLTFASLIFPDVKQDPVFIPSISDAEEEIWRTRIERGEFTEKVKEKSKSIADLMILTHIEPSDESDDTDRERNSLTWRQNLKSSLTSTNFGSDSDIRHAVLEEGFHESLKKLSSEHKEYGRFDSLNMIVPDHSKRENFMKTLESNALEDVFLGNDASELKDNSGQVQENACILTNDISSSHKTEVGSAIPVINIEEVKNDVVDDVEEETFNVEYTAKPRRFVLKDEKESSVVFGPFDDDSLCHFQGVRTTFGNSAIIDNWDEHLDAALKEQINQADFENVTFQSLEMKPDTNEVEENAPIINKITNLMDNIWSEEDTDGKLRTPDDERSSDSGFRDKGSLSESVEDACEGKYNLEDIEAELEEAFVKGAFNTAEDESGEKNSRINFEFEETKFYDDGSKHEEDFSDVDGEIEIWQNGEKEYFPEVSDLSPSSAKGWYLHPPEDEDNGDFDMDDEFVKALRSELAEKLPMPCRSFEVDEEEDFSANNHTINIQYAHPTVLTSIEEEGDSEGTVPSPNNTKSRRPNNVSGLMESVKCIDTETFMQYLDFMVENEGKDEDLAVIEEVNCIAEECNTPMIVITKDDSEKPNNEVFENDIKNALGFEEMVEEVTEQPTSIVVLEDLEDETCSKPVDETKPDEDVLLINTATNEATLMESPKPKSHAAFLNRNGDFTPDSISPDRDISSSDDSSRGEASTDINSSPDLLSDFLITPDKTPFESPRTIPKITIVEVLKKDNDAAEIVGDLLKSGMLKNTVDVDEGLAKSGDGDQHCSLPYISQKPSLTESFLKNERLHTTDLLLESSKKLERFEMSTSFMGDDDDGDDCSDAVKGGTTEGSGVTSDNMEGSYTPDWENDSVDDDSSSGEFIWKLHESSNRSEVATEAGAASSADKNNGDNDGDDGSDDGSSSDSASITDFVPSAWDSQATPSKSALRSPDKKTDTKKRRVWFKKEKYQCIYEYPREPSDTEEPEPTLTSHVIDYSQFADWELQDDGDDHDESTDTDSDSKILAPKSPNKYDFYTISTFDDLANNGTLSDDGEFFVSSSTRPFQTGSLGPFFTGSQFTAYGNTNLWPSSPTTDNILDETDFITPDSGVEDLCGSTPGDSPPETDSSKPPSTVDEVVSSNVIGGGNVGKTVGGGLGIGSSRSSIESLTLDLPKSHNADLGFVLNGSTTKGQEVDPL